MCFMKEQRHFSGIKRLYGENSLRKLFESHVAIVGLGGVGSWATEALVRSGIGNLTLIDFDQVAESNINRQLHATELTIGQSKVHAMQERIFTINPNCHVQAIDEFVTPQNWPSLLQYQPDIVIDACDQVSAKKTLALWSLNADKNIIIAGAAGGKHYAGLVEMADLTQVTHDPLLARLRQSLRRALKESTEFSGAQSKLKKNLWGLPCVFSREPIKSHKLLEKQEIIVKDNYTREEKLKPLISSPLNCHGYGSSVMVTATFGFRMADCALRDLLRYN